MTNKEDILNTIAQVITALGEGKISSIDPLLDLLKKQTCTWEGLQECILDFIQQVEFQKDYDAHHLVNNNIQKSADKLIREIQKLDKI